VPILREINSAAELKQPNRIDTEGVHAHHTSTPILCLLLKSEAQMTELARNGTRTDGSPKNSTLNGLIITAKVQAAEDLQSKYLPP